MDDLDRDLLAAGCCGGSEVIEDEHSANDQNQKNGNGDESFFCFCRHDYFPFYSLVLSSDGRRTHVIAAQSFKPDVRCKNTIETACDILEKVINDYEAGKN